jgi:WD40 repeat protein
LAIYFFFLKVLDAPKLEDDFYLSLIDWSSQNILSVGIESCVYLWSAYTNKVTMLCDVSAGGNSVTSVAWNKQVSHNSMSLFLCRTVNVSLLSVKFEFDYCLFC